jgi:hypothetical protein
MFPLPHLKTETVPGSETFYFLVIWDSGRLTKTSDLSILSATHHRQNPLNSVPQDMIRTISEIV